MVWTLNDTAVWAHVFGGATSLRARLLGGRELGAYLLMTAVAMRPWGSEFEPRLPAVSRPVQVMWGVDDPWSPLGHGRDRIQAIGTDLVTLPGASHIAQVEARDITADKALAFLAQAA